MLQAQEDSQTRAIITAVCNASSSENAVFIFKMAAAYLPNCKIVLAAKSGALPGFAVNRMFSAGAAVRSLFNTQNVFVLDKETVREMESGRAIFPIDFSISLDTQALSYLEPYLCCSTEVPSDFKEVFNFIARDDVSVDPLPYRLENLHNLHDLKAADVIFAKLRAYETLRTLDGRWLQIHGEARSTLTEPELTKRAQEHISNMFMNLNDERLMSALHFRQQVMYCYLLKMASIQIRDPRASTLNKLNVFVEFCDNELATIGCRETAIARFFFERGQKLAFFGKVQKNKSDIFKILDGMAWDLWHVRQLEELMTLKPSPHARYFFPALLTFDKKLIEIIDLYPLKACAYIEGTNEPMPFYDGDWLQLIAGDEKNQSEFFERFYSAEARISRESRREAQKARFRDVVNTLESELSEVTSVKKRSP